MEAKQAAAAPAPDALAFLGIAALSALLKAGKLSAVELTQSCLDRIERLDSDYNAFIHVDLADALSQARAAHKEISSGHWRGPMHGVPYALKDLIDVRGLPTTCHSKIRANHVAAADAFVVRKLKDAGAIMLGKAALHEFATGGPCRDLPWPPALNPWDRLRHPGGSSSGSAVAVATGMAPASVGTDTGGSIRNPATCCGLIGMKPTYGAVSREGVFPLAPSMDHVGPITRTVQDNAILLQAMVGHDPSDPTSVEHPRADFLAEMHLPLAGLRIGIVEHFHDADLVADPEIVDALHAAAAAMESLGAHVGPVHLAPLSEWVDCGLTIQRVEQYAIHAKWLQERPQDYSKSSPRKLMPGAQISQEEYALMAHKRRALAESFDAVMEKFDALVLVSSHDLPCLIDDEPEVIRTYGRQARMPFNVTGTPVIAVPTGFSRSGLPLGMQIAGRRFEESLLYRIAARYCEATPWLSRHPEAVSVS